MADPTVITVQTVKGPFETIAADGVDFIFAAGTITDGDVFTCTGRELLIVKNDNVAAKYITITSVDNDKGRSEDITQYSIGASEFAVFGIGLTQKRGWMNSSKQVRITVEHADVKVAVLRLPAGYP